MITEILHEGCRHRYKPMARSLQVLDLSQGYSANGMILGLQSRTDTQHGKTRSDKSKSKWFPFPMNLIQCHSRSQFFPPLILKKKSDPGVLPLMTYHNSERKERGGLDRQKILHNHPNTIDQYKKNSSHRLKPGVTHGLFGISH